MLKCSTDSIIDKINKEECFHAVSEDYSFEIKIEKYVHFVAAAVHDGSQFRKSLWLNCTHSAYDRWYEEDPHTGYMINSLPIVIKALDSRFEYDLNRPLENCVYDDAWGKSLWKKSLPEHEIILSKRKHESFYKVVAALIQKLESKFNLCIVLDLHSYNWVRWERAVPTWNIGTKNIDNTRFKATVDLWIEMLSKIKLPYKISPIAAQNDTFYGNGYFLRFITSKFNNTLVLATEIKKVYCDELLQIQFPEVIEAFKLHLETSFPILAETFYYKTLNQ